MKAENVQTGAFLCLWCDQRGSYMPFQPIPCSDMGKSKHKSADAVMIDV